MSTDSARQPDASPSERLPRTLNLGCGKDYREDAHNVDISHRVDPDAVFDVSDGVWPLPADHFDHVIAHHVFEHVDSIPFRELERVTRDGGTLELTFPIGHTRFEDPTHRQYWGWHTAEAIAGERKHAHEVSSQWTLTSKQVDWKLTGHAPLMRAYIACRRLVDGLGPWVEQVPGVYGEIIATYRYSAHDE